MNFNCNNLKVEEVIVCSLGFKKSEFKIVQALLKENSSVTIQQLSEKMNLDRTTIQKVVKKFYEKGLVDRNKINLESGGYTFSYKLKEKKVLKNKIRSIVQTWSNAVLKKIDDW